MDTGTAIAWLLPGESTLDPVTGFVDRSWFDLALAQPQPQPPPAPDGFGSGVIAVRLNDLALLERDDGIAGRDGCLLLAAAILHRFARTGDLAARLGPDQFALLTSRTPSDFTKTALRTCGGGERDTPGGWLQGLRGRGPQDQERPSNLLREDLDDARPYGLLCPLVR